MTDNSAAPDGRPGFLKVGYDGRRLVKVASGTTKGGQLKLKFRPPHGPKTATMRMCALAISSNRAECSTLRSVRL
jgi:hypothetical protein